MASHRKQINAAISQECKQPPGRQYEHAEEDINSS
jgi:hypothetical protein